ncbi:MAG: phosphate acyltransferase PlsX [Clostridiales bacterium]|nr:phosphate acyltransferase PlsX [Clostridiales bacterium]
MKIALDVMGGDHAPDAILDGGKDALAASGALELILVGDRDAILSRYPQAEGEPRVEIVHCSEVIGMDEHPARAYRQKKDASITVASKLVADKTAQAVVSAGSTGAQMVAALFEIGRMEGVSRPAIASFIPTLKGPRVILDVGANLDSLPENLRQFGWLGRIYCSVALGIDNPRIYLLSNGAEAEKGNAVTKEAFGLLEASGLNFVGNVEAREITRDMADVIVCDGFVGNVILKLVEGVAITLMSIIKREITADTRSKIGALLVRPSLKRVAKTMDYSNVGGAPLLGVRGNVVKAHGSSNGHAMACAIGQAVDMIESDAVGKIEKALACAEHVSQ